MQAILGVLVGIIFILAYIPQLKTLYLSNEVQGVSKIFWLGISLATSITTTTLIESHSVWYVVAPQCINAFIAFIILIWVTYKKFGLYGTWVYFMIYAFSISVLSKWVPNDVVQHWSSLIIMFVYIEQIAHLIYNKTAQGVNYLLYVGFATGLIIMIINMSFTGAPVSAIITELTNVIMMIIAVFATIILNKKQN